MDNRGTGTSALIDCRRLQRYTGLTLGPAFPGIVAGCARADRAPLPRPAAGARRPVRHRLRGRRPRGRPAGACACASVDLYGDSYGTWFAQSFISRYRERLHSVMLDSAYPVRGLDPWYASSGEVAREALDAVCERDAGCSAAAPGSAWSASAGWWRRRGGADHGRHPRRRRQPRRARASTCARVVDMVQDAASEPIIYRELDASVRAALGGDDVPLLRLVAQSQHLARREPGGLLLERALLRGQLHGLSAAVLDALHAGAAPRAAGGAPPPRRPARSRRSPPREWLTMSAYSEPYEACLDWPAPRAHARRPCRPGVPPLPASVPLLVVGGDLDSLTRCPTPASSCRARGHTSESSRCPTPST